jgi:uroporphyrinogen decarboxylase
MSAMTSKERVLAVLQGNIPDRVPTLTFGIDPIFIKKMGGGDLEKTFEVFGLDVYPIYSQNWCQGMPIGAGAKMDIPAEMQTSGGTYAGWDGIDEFGRVWKKGSYVGGVVKTAEDIEKYVPALQLEKRTNPAKTKQFLDSHADKAFALITHTGPFGLTMESIGFEEFLYMFIDDRKLIETFLWERTRWFAEIAAYGAELGADFILMGDDVAFKGSTFISPQDFESLMLPCYKHIVEKAGVPVIWHSDGYITPLLDMAVKSGFAGVHSLEPTAGVDMAAVKKDYGEKLILVGNVDCGEILCQADRQKVRVEVRRCMDQAKAGGRYMLSDSNAIHSACHPDAVTEMFRYAREIGKY